MPEYTEYRIFTFKIPFWHSAKYHILTFKILFWHCNCGLISYIDIQNPILTFELWPNIVFWHSKFSFDIWNLVEYRILTYKILFWHWNCGRISYLTFKILFWLSTWRRISYFDIENPFLTFEVRPNIVFWHSKSYFDIRNEARYCI